MDTGFRANSYIVVVDDISGVGNKRIDGGVFNTLGATPEAHFHKSNGCHPKTAW